ncbi:protein ENHANCED DOWNY MILDEW 2-like isoform X1 [Typha latifolia]|uniref:protein ENHANCED DOWNY MILDEW 2-like isoform X1 n=2 Tax=Typha latifolia TaxID=4733 RepID=UPI003C2E8466
MAISDDEVEVMTEAVTNYYFVDRDEVPISFAVLPIQFNDAEKIDAAKEDLFLHGTTDGGLQKVFKQVTAWKLGLQDEQPTIAVLSKDNKWISLLKPRKSYEDTIRTIMITVQMLYFLKRNQEASEKRLWDHLRNVYSTFEVRPSEEDFKNHISLMKLFAQRDETLAKSQLLLDFLKEKPRKRFGEILYHDALEVPDMKQPFIADNDEVDDIMEDDDGDESEEESDLFDSVCAICDNGGELLCCEGRCMRSFHATKKAGEESQCRSLGFTRLQVESIQSFLCKNCEYKRHQCFVCGKLGSSDKSSGAEVFPCVNATCGHFYHPKCVAELLYPDNKAEASEYEEKIAMGMSFTCPVHKCIVCKLGENKEITELQFAMCRRCPKSYHRKCLPRKIAFGDTEEEDIIQRAWEDLLPNRILIYCLKHKIDDDLGTPIRNHIIFPDIPEKKKITDMQKERIRTLVNKKRQVSGDLPLDQSTIRFVNVEEKLSSAQSQSTVRTGRTVTEQIISSQKKIKPLKEKSHTVIGNDKNALEEKAKPSEMLRGNIIHSSFPVIDSETEKKVIALMEKESSSLTLGDITRSHIMPSTHAFSSRHVDKTITRGKVEGSVEAIQTALQKLEDGGSVEDAKAVCEPEIVKQLIKWNNKLKVYLAPFLHGMRYTSFGRHFTKVDKLKEIVDKLQWYVQAGDTIVDFCCGANDFSQLMKEKLDAAGKRCNFKNYDVIQPKNDFNFEKRDWMKVQTKELPSGSQLIMGLNPPFGVKAALANKFIDKALTFRPKLVILIVPEETERLDKKRVPYDLIWEDGGSLSGKSFYLPGSVDVDDKQIEQWNLKPPLLYLWSRSDWTSRHKAIALKHNHQTGGLEELSVKTENQVKKQVDALPVLKRIGEHEHRAITQEETEPSKEDSKSSECHDRRKSPEIPTNKSHKRRRRSKKKIEASEAKEVDQSSDMSISPSREIRNQPMGCLPLEPVAAPLEMLNHQGGMSIPPNREMGNQPMSCLPLEPVLNHQTIMSIAPSKDIGNQSVGCLPSGQVLAPLEMLSHQPTMSIHPNREIGNQSMGCPPLERVVPPLEMLNHHATMSTPPSREIGNQPMSCLPFEAVLTPLEMLNHQSNFYRSGAEFGIVPPSELGSSNMEIDDIAKRYTTPPIREGLYDSNSVNWYGGGITRTDYRIQSSEERFSGYTMDKSMEPFCSNPNVEFSEYGRLSESDIQMQQQSFTQRVDDYPQMNRYSFGAPDTGVGRTGVFPPSSYGLSASVAGTSTMDKYAPRLNETNYTRAGSLGPGAPLHGVSGMYDMHGVRRDVPPDPTGYAPRQQHPYPHPGSSSGWLNR